MNFGCSRVRKSLGFCRCISFYVDGSLCVSICAPGNMSWVQPRKWIVGTLLLFFCVYVDVPSIRIEAKQSRIARGKHALGKHSEQIPTLTIVPTPCCSKPSAILTRSPGYGRWFPAHHPTGLLLGMILQKKSTFPTLAERKL